VEVILSRSERRVPHLGPLGRGRARHRGLARRPLAGRGTVRPPRVGGEGEDHSCRGAKQDGTAVAEDDSGGSDFVCGWSRAEKTSDGVSAVAGAVVPGKAPEAPPLGLPEEGIS
jgi:hypothetical protein